MFEEIDLKVADTQNLPYPTAHFSVNKCSNSSCAGTNLHYCC